MRIKYPRTYHFDWSPGLQNDDRRIENLEGFKGKEVVITEKMDGENTSIYLDHIHARSMDSGKHESRNWLNAFAARFQYKIPVDWRICGENMYAKHSVFYKALPNYFLGFSIWDNHNVCQNWDTTLNWFLELGITPVKELYRGTFSMDIPWDSFVKEDEWEGYVMRVTDSFHYDDFHKVVAKYVRKNHVQTSAHWMTQEVVKNGRLEE